MTASALIVRTSLACPLGLRSQDAIAALKAKLSQFEVDESMPSATVSRLSTLDPRSTWSKRMGTLARYALIDLFARSPDVPWPATLPTFLSLPSARGGVAYDVDELAQSISEMVASACGARVELARERLVWSGRSGVFEAIERALTHLASSGSSLALVGGVDSLVDPQSLRWLADRGWLSDLRNPDGRVPGEAASFLLLALPRITRWRPRAELRTLELDHDAACFASYCEGDAPVRGDGLARCFSRLRSTAEGRCDVLASGQPSESYWSRDLSYAYLRNATLMPEPMRSLNVADRLGDLGAATGSVALTRAVDSFWPRPWERHANTSALVYGVSDRGQVGAVLLARPQGGES